MRVPTPTLPFRISKDQFFAHALNNLRLLGITTEMRVFQNFFSSSPLMHTWRRKNVQMKNGTPFSSSPLCHKWRRRKNAKSK